MPVKETAEKRYNLRRPQAEIADIALRQQGGIGALKAMGALEAGLTEEELSDVVARAEPGILDLGSARALDNVIINRTVGVYDICIIEAVPIDTVENRAIALFIWV